MDSPSSEYIYVYSKYYRIYFILIIVMFPVVAQSVTVKSTGCGFDPHSRKLNIYLHLYFHFFFLVSRQSAKSGEQSVLQLGSLCLPCWGVRYRVKLKKKHYYFLLASHFIIKLFSSFASLIIGLCLHKSRHKWFKYIQTCLPIINCSRAVT